MCYLWDSKRKTDNLFVLVYRANTSYVFIVLP